MAFFRMRPGPDGKPVSELLGNPEGPYQGNGWAWFRCQWLGVGMVPLPLVRVFDYYKYETAWHGSKIGWQSVVPSKYETAWHASKFETLYSTMYHQELLPSVDGSGFRYLSGVPEWFADKVKLSVHKIATADKVNDYVCFTPLCEDGVFWAAKWEVRVDKKRQIVNLSKNNLDRWIQQRGSVHLIALWLCGVKYEHMVEGAAFSTAWNPRFEANPMNRI